MTSTFLTLWPRLSTWTPTSPLVDADESLARFAAEHGHPVVVKFLEDQATATKTVKEFLQFVEVVTKAAEKATTADKRGVVK
eukprot:COSAG06_NODE_1834_length_8257_cov_188.231920_4_plen_82_part_00